MNTTRFRRSAWAPAALVAAVSLALAGCAADEETSAPAGEGVSFGASMEEYQAALADMTPVTLKIQGAGPEGSLIQVGTQAWADAIEEWSDGRITFDWSYSSAAVPSVTELPTALADGRLDVVRILPYATPEVFPRLDELNTATMLDGNTPLGTLQQTAWVTDVIYNSPEIQQELDDNGIHVLTMLPSASYGGIFCTQERSTLDELSSVLVSASGQALSQELSGIGMTPQSIAFTELFEALERHVVECAATVTTSVDTIGATDLVPHALMDTGVGLVGFSNLLAISTVSWDALPLAAQQLLVDRLDVLYGTEAEGQASRSVGWVEQIRAAGGGIVSFDDEARERLLEVNDELLSELGAAGADVDGFVDAHTRWEALLEELYPELVSPSFEDFLLDGAFEDVDFSPFTDAMFEEILLPHRPS
ncbi:MAG: hypothetical protein QM602_10460 [Microbacterium sp.]